MNVSAPAIERPVATTLLTLALLLAGGSGVPAIAGVSFAAGGLPGNLVSGFAAGRQSRDHGFRRCHSLERQFGRIAGINQMTSVSQLGSTGITMQFDLDRNIDAAARDVQAAINAARNYLPPNLPRTRTYRKINPADAPIMILA